MKELNYSSNKYYKYNEIILLLQMWQNKFPNEFSYEVIGKSYEKRDIFAVTITAKTNQQACEKPAYYIDANHHAGEVTGSSVALYTINYLLNNYQKDERVSRLLEKYTFYIIPRIAVDGSEQYLTTAQLLRSSVKEYSPRANKGTILKDMNNDGLILQMRFKASDGLYKKSKKDDRVMIRREPDDIYGEFYHVLPEGEIEDYDGVELRKVRSKNALDFNRNYPINWKPEHIQAGAGDYPLSEPETRSVADFILNHKNIAGIMSYHTTGGMILRPFCTVQDKKMNKEDLQAFEIIGDIGERLTSYPCWSIFEKFTFNKDNPSVGSFMDFTYDYLGITTFATELWNLRARAGLEPFSPEKYKKQTAKEFEKEQLALLKYSDEKHNGELFVDWQEFTHPQLGLVEIGGLRPKFGRQNPPISLLTEECHKNMLFTLSHAESIARLVIINSQAIKISENVFKVIVDFANAGYLPTSGSKLASKNNIANKVEAILSDNVDVVKGKRKCEFKPLNGFSKKRAEWLINSKAGTEITVTIKSQRAGVVTKKIELK